VRKTGFKKGPFYKKVAKWDVRSTSLARSASPSLLSADTGSKGMVRQQSPLLLQIGWAILPALNDQTVFHAPTLNLPPCRVQPKMKRFLLPSRPPIRHHHCQLIAKT